MLVRALLQSSLFISLASALNIVQAATIPVAVPGSTAFGFNDYHFTANVDLNIPDGINLNNTAGDSVSTFALNTGTLRFRGSSTITGDVGILGGNDIANIYLNRGSLDKTVIFQGSVAVQNIDYISSFGHTVIFEQSVGRVASPAFLVIFNYGRAIFKANAEMSGMSIGFEVNDQSNAAVIFEGVANFSDEIFVVGKATLTLNGGGTTAALNGRFRISNLGQVNFGHDFNVGESILLFDTGSTTRVFSGKTVTVGNDLITASGVVLGFDLGLTSTPGLFDIGNNADIVGNEIVNIINPGLTNYAFGINGPVTLVRSGTGATVAAAPELNAPNNLFISFDLSVDGTNKLLQLTGTRVMPTGLQSNIAGVAEVLGNITTANAPNEFIDLGNQLGLYYGTEAQKEALASAAPMNDSAFHQVITDIQQNTFDLFSKRIEEQFVHLDNYHTGYAAGLTDEQGNGSWVKLFGSNIKQGTRQNINGYTAGVWGIALGVDSKVSDTSLLGASFSWATASVNHDVGGSNTNINNYQGAMYASKHDEEALFLNGMLSLAYNQYDAAHRIVINNFNRTNFAHFHGWQYAARLESGYHYKLKQDLFEIQPIISVNYTHTTFNAYQEKGSSLTVQKIAYDNMNTLIADIGIKFFDEIQKHDHKFIREAHLSVGYDLIGDRQKTTAQYIGFGSAYTMDGFSPARAYYNLGLSLTTYGQGNIDVSFGYDYFWKQDYHAHAGFLKVRYNWH